ncbi:MAG TPA: mandelate racemase/muconate lactonizing enzyme family protein [Bryobacteraceae bacterium]|nr:mandelate racemase/muconate lactonizing enzyme family protein [Bryobacteraceae bacterium]
MKRVQARDLSRRAMLCQAALASGLGGIFTMSASGQQGTPGRVPTGGQQAGGGGGGRGASVHYGPINKFSSPSDLKITDIRALRIAANFDYPVIKVYTNQDVYGLGEVRDAGNENLALGMKPLLVGRNPLDISGILQSVRPYAGPGRQGGGFSAIDIALHDITGKVYGVPVWRLLGDKKRDRVRMYCDTTGTSDPKKYGDRMVARMKIGFTFFKMDVTTNFVGIKPGYLDTEGVPTDKGLEYGAELITAVRDAIGWDKPLAVDASSLRCGTVPDGIRAAQTFEKCRLSWLEDLFYTGGFWRWKEFKEIKAHTRTPLLTGEDGFGLEEGFQQLIDNRAVDIIHLDHGTSGGCRETKRIADYAFDRERIPTAIHMAGSPLATIAAVHTAATLDSYIAMECHAVDFLVWWQQLITGVPQPLIDKGYIAVPDAPGLGVELNEKVVKEHLRKPGYFDPTTKWDDSITGRGEGGPWPHFNVDGVWVNERTSDY